MKKSPLLLLTVLPLAAADLPSLRLPDLKIELPPLSLAGSVQPDPPGALSVAGAWFRSPAVAAATRLVSHMPVRAPRTDLDPKMVKAPDSSTDYKMIVKAPDVEFTK